MHRNQRTRGKAVLLGAVLALTAAAPPSGADDGVDAEALYLNNCAACHGPFGEGDGPVATALRAAVPNLRTLRERNDGVFPADAVTAYIDGRDVPTAHGSRLMPIWGDVFRWAENGEQDPDDLGQRRIEALVAFLEELQYR